jgi:hypothetical protein
MEKIKSTLDISKGGGMSGIGTDQSALLRDEEFKTQSEDHPEQVPDINPKDLNTPGGPNYGRTSKIPDHKSALLNKLDPRIGYTDKEIDENIASYEAKYGKPKEGFMEEMEETPGSSMSGIGPNQSALSAPVDSEGHK